jgi:hypothetical protein
VARILTGGEDHDAWGQYAPRHGDYVDDDARAERLTRGGEDEVWWGRCSMCHRDLRAVDMCPVCGDHEDMAA